MEKKHASCSNIHHNRSVQFLIQKFEGICKSIHEQIKQPKCTQISSPTTGRVAETVAKFEECLILQGDNKMRNSCSGDPNADSWLIELNEKIAQHVARQEKLAVMDKQQCKKLSIMEQQLRKQQQQQAQLQQEQQQQLDAHPLEGHFTETFPLPLELTDKLGVLKISPNNIGIIEEHLNALSKNHNYFTIKSGNYLKIP